jgi:parallel beta-helix repeat protein
MPSQFRSPTVHSILLRRLVVLTCMLCADMVQAVSVAEFGAVGDGKTDATRAIQSALNTGRKVLIPEGTYLISNCLEPMSNQEIELIGTLKVADAQIQPLAEDVVAGQPKIRVPDASGFRVGQWVSLGDENLPIQGGGRKTRREAGECTRIVGIEGNVLILGANFKKSYSVAAKARVASQPSAILIEDKSNIHIRGTGIIDANKANQFDFAPGMMDQPSEETRAGCGITVHSNKPGRVANISITGITVRDAILHNISLYGARDSSVTNVTSAGAHDKNILLRYSERCRIQGNTCINSEWEDGIIVYFGNNHCLIQGNICSGNRRMGICVNAFQDGISLVGNICSDNALNFLIRGDHGSSTGDISAGKGSVELRGRGNVITGLISNGPVMISATDLTMNGGMIGSRGTEVLKVGMLIKRTSDDRRMALAQGIRIQGVVFRACITGIAVGGVLEDVQLVENRFRGVTKPVEIAEECRGKVLVARNEGFTTENRGIAQITGPARSVKVLHGLQIAPRLDDIAVTPANSLGNAKKFWISEPTATSFEIFVDSAPGAEGAKFAWQIK